MKKTKAVFDRTDTDFPVLKKKTIPILVDMDWELDTVRINLLDNKKNYIGTLIFDCEDFQNLAGDIACPDISDEDEKSYKKLSKKEKAQLQKECEEDAKYMKEHPIKKEIEKLHRKK